MSKPEVVFEPDTVQAIFPDGVRGVIEREERDLYYHSEDAHYSADELRAIADKMDSMGGETDGGWIPWYSGECPVPRGTLVDVKHRDGEVYRRVPARYAAFEGNGSAYDWEHDGSVGDIIAYRVSEV